MQEKLSESNRKSAENIKEINKLKQISQDTNIKGTPNIIDVNIDGDINVRRNNGNDGHFIEDSVDFQKFRTLEL